MRTLFYFDEQTMAAEVRDAPHGRIQLAIGRIRESAGYLVVEPD